MIDSTSIQLPPLAHFIGGAFTSADSTEGLELRDPATDEPLGTLPRGGAAEVEEAVASARAALPAWSARTPADRSGILLAIADRVEEHREELERLESLGTGKPPAVAADDIASTIDIFRFTAGAIRSLTTLATGEYAEGHLSMILREPVGVVGAITPWNYPLLTAAWKLAPVLGAGNTIVVKPSEQTPLTTLSFAELTKDLLPEGVLSVVLGTGPEVGAALSAHPGVDLISVTGSVRSGSAVAEAASASRKRVHLELGGKAPALVFADADLDAVAKGIRTGGFWNTGQECGAACRVLVERSVAKELERRLADEIGAITVGAPDEAPEIGPVVSRAHFDRVLAGIRQAVDDGARVVTGGGAIDRPGCFIEPTLLADVEPGARTTRDEIFGPVVSIEIFDTEEEAVERANENDYGLSASVWTRDVARALDLVSRIDAGTVWVNAHLTLATEMPWGGFKGSGYGRDLSVLAIDDYSRTKHVCISRAR